MLIRSPEKAKKLEAFGVKPVVGSFKDLALVEKLSEEAHVVFSLVRLDRTRYRARVELKIYVYAGRLIQMISMLSKQS